MQKIFEALSDPTRRRILEILKAGSCSVQALAREFSISGASLSHHLSKLKNAELVRTERQGQKIIYSIHTSVFEDASQFIIGFFNVGESDDEKN